MPMTIALGARTATSVAFQTAGRTAGYDGIHFQYSTRKDFLFTPSPVALAIPDGGGVATLIGLNQDNLYWVRAREVRSADGAVGSWTDPVAAYTLRSTVRDVAPQGIMVRPAIIVTPAPIKLSLGSAQDAGHPVDNLLTDSPAEQWWSPYAYASYIRIETSGQPWDTIALLGTNLPSGATWYIYADDNPAGINGGAATYKAYPPFQFHASPDLPGRPSYHGLHRVAGAPRTERFIHIYFDGVAPHSNFYAATYLVVGLARIAKNIAADKVEAPLDYGGLERLRDGTPDRRIGFRARRVEFEIALMTEAQWETQFADLRNAVGFTDPVLVVPNTRTGSFLHDRILYGAIAQNRATQPFTPRFTQSFSIESLI